MFLTNHINIDWVAERIDFHVQFWNRIEKLQLNKKLGSLQVNFSRNRLNVQPCYYSWKLDLKALGTKCVVEEVEGQKRYALPLICFSKETSAPNFGHTELARSTTEPKNNQLCGPPMPIGLNISHIDKENLMIVTQFVTGNEHETLFCW